MSLIRLENVSLTRQGKTLLSNLNWTVEKGQTWAILGPVSYTHLRAHET